MSLQRLLEDCDTSIFNVQQTSRQSFKELGEEKRITREQEYMNKLWETGEPSTDYEVTKFAGYSDPNRYRPRRRSLVKKGLIEECNERPDKYTGRTAIPFWFSIEGLRMVGANVK